MIDKEYNPFKKTALSRTSPSVPTRTLHKKGLIQGKCLDVGCGKGFNVKWLKEHGIHIEGYDKFNEEFKNEELLNDKYDTVICDYVFNVVPDLNEHKELLEKLKNIGENIYISVRSDDKAIRPTWEFIKECDCYKTPKNSYQRFYDEGKVIEMFGEVEFIISNTSLRLFKIKK